MFQKGLKTGDLDLTFKVKLALELKNFVQCLMNATTFESWEFYLQT